METSKSENDVLDHFDLLFRLVKLTIAKKFKKLFWCETPEKKLKQKSPNFIDEMQKEFQTVQCETKIGKPVIQTKLKLNLFDGQNKVEQREISAETYLERAMRYFEYEVPEQLYSVIFNKYQNSGLSRKLKYIHCEIITNQTGDIHTLALTIAEQYLNHHSRTILENIIQIKQKTHKNPNAESCCKFGLNDIDVIKYPFGDEQLYRISTSKLTYIDCYDRTAIRIIFHQVLMQTLKHCRVELAYIPFTWTDYEDVSAHAMAMVVEYNSSNDSAKAFVFDPVERSTNQVFELERSLDAAQYSMQNNRFNLYQEAIAPYQNFQAVWRDNTGYCVIYSLIWLEFVLNIKQNIKMYNEEMKQKDPKSIQLPESLLSWGEVLSSNLNKVTEIINLKFKNNQEFNKMYDSKDANQEFVLRYLLKLLEEFMIKYPEPASKLQSTIVQSMQMFDYEKQKQFATKDGQNENRYIMGKHFADLSPEKFEKDLVKDPFFGHNLPWIETEDLTNIQNESELEDFYLRKRLKKHYETECKKDSDCKNEKMDMICDKFHDNKSGYCIPKKKLIKDNCNSNQECLSKFCDPETEICRLRPEQIKFLSKQRKHYKKKHTKSQKDAKQNNEKQNNEKQKLDEFYNDHLLQDIKQVNKLLLQN